MDWRGFCTSQAVDAWNGVEQSLAMNRRFSAHSHKCSAKRPQRPSFVAGCGTTLDEACSVAATMEVGRGDYR